MAERGTTRSAALALAEERTLMRQGYGFLDEKRMLLAAEILRRLERHQALETALAAATQTAAAALRAALARHGQAGLQAYPAAGAPTLPPPPALRFLGVVLQETPTPRGGAAAAAAADPSPEAEACRAAFAALLAPLAALAASAASLERLGHEYDRTGRRARALENVLLPEIEHALAAIDEHLALAEQEEAVRIRLAARRLTQMG